MLTTLDSWMPFYGFMSHYPKCVQDFFKRLKCDKSAFKYFLKAKKGDNSWDHISLQSNADSHKTNNWHWIDYTSKTNKNHPVPWRSSIKIDR